MVRLAHLAEFPFEVDLNHEVEIPRVPRVGPHRERPAYLLALFNRHVVLEIEHGLFPVSIRGFRGRAETDPLVALGKLHVEESYQCLYVVVASDLEL